MKEEIGFIEEIATGRDEPFKLFGIKVLPISEGWLGISKFYEDSKLKRLLFMKQLGVYYTNDKNYKIGDKVKVEIDNKKIVSVTKIGHLDWRDNISPMYIYSGLIFFIIILLSYLNVHI